MDYLPVVHCEVAVKDTLPFTCCMYTTIGEREGSKHGQMAGLTRLTCFACSLIQDSLNRTSLLRMCDVQINALQVF